MTQFKDKVVIITGAGLSLGRALAKAFAAEGAKVALNDLMPTNIETLEQEILADGGIAKSYALDVAKKMPVQALVNMVEDDFGGIDILVNHASVQPHTLILDMDEWDWRRVFDVILNGTFLASQSAGRVMRENGGGVILNIGPTVGENPRVAYLAAKQAVQTFTQAAAPEFAEHKIMLNLLTPDRNNMEASVKAAMELCKGQVSGQLVEV